MSIVKSFSVGDGDMFYIDHESDNFTVIDCFVDGVKCEVTVAERKAILEEISERSRHKGITRFISTHPDEDHIGGLEAVIDALQTTNFYCVENSSGKKGDESDSFKFYRKIRSAEKTFYVYAGCSRKWLNAHDQEDVDDHGCSGINFLWPDRRNPDFKAALESVKDGEGFNNISPIFTYSIKNGATFMWMGDIESDFLTKIQETIVWPSVDVLFAPHHGRESGKVTPYVLEKINPRLVVIGEAPSEHLDYYRGYGRLTQLSARDITFCCSERRIDVFCSNPDYTPSAGTLIDMKLLDFPNAYYIGSLG